MIKCSKCHRRYATSASFQDHECVRAAINEDPKQRLDRMLEKGLITNVYYDYRMKQLSAQ